LITLKQALKLQGNDLKDLQKQISDNIENSNLNAHIENFTNTAPKIAGNGVPISIKNNINVKDWEIDCCSKILKSYKSPYNATVVDKLLDNGLSPMGLTNMDEFAMGSTTENSCYGATKNPFDLNCVPGGSSGGSASAVGGKEVIAALGSDTGGSIRQPAAFCGCVGMKPTYGRVSRYGLVAFSSSLDQIGPITQNVEDGALLYDIISGHDNKDSTSSNMKNTSVADKLNSNAKLTIAVIENYIDKADSVISTKIKETISELEKKGHKIVYKNMMDIEQHISAYYTIATAEASTNLSRFDGIKYGQRGKHSNLNELYINSRTQGFGDEVKRRILLGTFVLSSGYYDAYYIKAQKVRHLIKQNYDEIFESADIIITPTTPSVAFELGSKQNGLDMYLEDIYTISVNLVGLPAISVPIGKDNNMPIGIQLIAPSYQEQNLFDTALSVEEIVS